MEPTRKVKKSMHTHTQTYSNSVHTRIVREDTGLVLLLITYKGITADFAVTHPMAGTLFGEALLTGSEGYTKEQLLNALSLLGSEISIQEEGHDIAIKVLMPKESVRKTMMLLSHILKVPLFPNQEIARIKKQLKGVLTLYKEDASTRARDIFVNQFVYPTDPRYTPSIPVLEKDLEFVTRMHLIALHKKMSSCAHTITVGGDALSTQYILKQLKSEVPNEYQSTPSLITVPKDRMVLLTNIPQKQNIEMAIGGALPFSYTHPSYPACYIALAVLGIYGGFAGRLMSQIREKEGLTYIIYAQPEGISKSESGFWRIKTFFSPKDVIQGITSTLREITLLQQKGITQDELRRFKDILCTRFTLTNDSLIKKVHETHHYLTLGVTHDERETFQASLQNLTLNEVNTTIREFVHPEKLVISGAGPVFNSEKNIRALLK